MIIWKGKGILIILYFIISMISILLINRYLIENFQFINKSSIEGLFGIILCVTGIWTRLTAEDFVKDKDGKKHKLDIKNELFFIKMKVWGLILPVLGIGLFIYGYIKPFI